MVWGLICPRKWRGLKTSLREVKLNVNFKNVTVIYPLCCIKNISMGNVSHVVSQTAWLQQSCLVSCWCSNKLAWSRPSVAADSTLPCLCYQATQWASFFTDYLKTQIECSHLDPISPGFAMVTFSIHYNVQIRAYRHFGFKIKNHVQISPVAPKNKTSPDTQPQTHLFPLKM